MSNPIFREKKKRENIINLSSAEFWEATFYLKIGLLEKKRQHFSGVSIHLNTSSARQL